VASLIQIFPLSKEILPHAKQMLTDGLAMDGWTALNHNAFATIKHKRQP